MGLFLACDWILGLRYEIWKETEGDGVKEDDEQNTMRSLIKGYQQDINVLSQLTSHLPAAFPQVRVIPGDGGGFSNTFFILCMYSQGLSLSLLVEEVQRLSEAN